MIARPNDPTKPLDPVFDAKRNQENNLISMVKGFSDEHLLFMSEQIEKEINFRVERAQAMIDRLAKKH